MESFDQKIGLVLPGGGARGAYQVGVLKAISDIQGREEKLQPCYWNFEMEY